MTDVLVLTLIFIYSAWIIMHPVFIVVSAVPAAVLVRKAAGQVSTEGRGRKN